MEVGDFLANPTYMVTGLVMVLAGYWFMSGKKNKLPPGPTPLPILGNILEFWRHPLTFKYFLEMRQKYGDVMTVQLGTIKAVVLNSMTVVREAIVNKQNDFAGRPSLYTTDLFTDGGKDIAFGQFTPVWKLQRKIAHGAIRKFMTGTDLEVRVTESIENVTEALKKQKEPFDPLKYVTLLIYNILANVTFGKQWNFDDPEFQELVDVVQEATDLFGNGLPQDYVPFLKHLPATAREKKLVKFVDWFYVYLRKIYQEHKDSYQPGKESDLMYHLIGMMKEAEEEGDSSLDQITDEHMFQVVNDVFFAGTDTSRFTLHWTLCYLAAYPEIQEKVFKEIDEVCGSYPVTLEARSHLNYTDAVLHEVLRIQPIVPLALPHTTTCDTSVGGYEIPKDTWVMINLWALHYDPKEWDDPNSFKPERFLDEDGKMAPKPNSYLPFSSGRRVCVGEALAKTELLLSLALLCQRFKFEAPPGEKVVPENVQTAIACMAKPYRIVCTPRKA